MKVDIKQLLVTVLSGVTVAILMPLITGCSSPGGCRTCRKESVGRPPTPQPVSPAPAVSGPGTSPASPKIAALPYGGQKTCPVTGEELGSMGEPIAVTLKGQTVYVCCRGCIAKAQVNPDKALAAVAAERVR